MAAVWRIVKLALKNKHLYSSLSLTFAFLLLIAYNATDRSKKRIKGQNFCQTIEYLSFHRFYQSIKRQICHYFNTFLCATFCFNKTERCRKEYTRLDR